MKHETFEEQLGVARQQELYDGDADIGRTGKRQATLDITTIEGIRCAIQLADEALAELDQADKDKARQANSGPEAGDAVDKARQKHGLVKNRRSETDAFYAGAVYALRLVWREAKASYNYIDMVELRRILASIKDDLVGSK